MRGRRATIVALVALLAAGCASLAPVGRASGDDGEEVGVADGSPDVLLRVSHRGGFVPPGWAFSAVAELTVYADGLAVTPGPTTLEHPGRLLPNLRTHRLTDEQLDAVVDAAADAGLLAEEPDYGRPAVTDVGSTLVVISVDGTTSTHDAYAFSLGLPADATGDGGLTPEQVAARQALDGFLARVRAQLDAAGDDGAHRPEAFAVMARPAATPGESAEPGDDVVVPAETAWPLADVALTGADCVVVRGDDAATLLPVLEGARQGDRFTQDGVVHDVWVRVLLPGDPGCAGDEAAPTQG